MTLEKEFTGNNRYFTWLDGHPKISLPTHGEMSPLLISATLALPISAICSLISFAHITIYALPGYTYLTDAKQYIQTCVDAFTLIEPVR